MLKSRLTIGLLLLSLFGATFTIAPATAAADEVKWTRVNIPTEGEASHFLLASGSVIRHLTMAADGTIYAHTDPPRGRTTHCINRPTVAIAGLTPARLKTP